MVFLRWVNVGVHSLKMMTYIKDGEQMKDYEQMKDCDRF